MQEDCLTLEDAPDGLTQNIANKLLINTVLTSQN
jgi:hypothetical protein